MVERIRRARVEGWSDGELRDETVGLAAEMLGEAAQVRTLAERYRGWKMDRMREDGKGKAFTFALLDRVLRPGGADRVAECVARLVERHGVPAYLPWHERGALLLAAETGQVLPEVVMPLMERVLRREVREPGRRGQPLGDAVRRTVRLPGEAGPGDEAAARRLAAHVARLAAPDCDCLSVKVSGVCSRIRVLAYDDTLERIKVALRTLYRAAGPPGGGGRAKMVHLDMGRFRDVALTMDAFREVLEEEEFMELEAGITLQAYLPESFPMQKELTEWAAGRVADGGGPVYLRLVKGGNLSMERIEASRHGWVAAPYGSKLEVDANFKRMLHHACLPEHAEVVRVGVGSHHLFDVAHALLLRAREGVEHLVGLEMLEGMAGGSARVAGRLAGGLSLYSAADGGGDDVAAVSELVGRLDESMALDSFRRDLHGMVVGGERWEEEKERFLEACDGWDEVSCRSRREQNREVEYPVLDLGAGFRNEALTDWSREENRDWIARWLDAQREEAVVRIHGGGDGRGEDRSDPGRVLCRFPRVTSEEARNAVARADGAWREWDAEVSDRRRLLKEAACGIGRNRGELVAVLVADAGLPVDVADVEVCRAVDFANYYADSLWAPGLGDGLSAGPVGVVVVRGAAEAPLAAVCGEVLAALMAGNAVVLVPAPETVLTAWRVAEVLWESGVPKELLRFLPVEGSEAMHALDGDQRVHAVPGGTVGGGAGAPGRNTMLISAMSDREQAISHLVASAFAQGVQAPGVVSLAIVEAEVSGDEVFRGQLRDAVASLPVGPGREATSVVTPLVRDPGEDGEKLLSELEAGEEWLLKPEHRGGLLWTPGIRTGVAAGGWFTRAAGGVPVLGLVEVKSFEEGMRVQNEVGGGWVGALQSLDEGEIEAWKRIVRAGVAHVNRPTAHPPVGRQPFGRWGSTGFAGGPNRVPALVRWREEGLPTAWGDRPGWMEEALPALEAAIGAPSSRLRAASGSYAQWWQEEFAKPRDSSTVLGETHVFRYRVVDAVVCRVAGMSLEDVALVCLATRCCGVALSLSGGNENGRELAGAAGVELVVETEDRLLRRLGDGQVLRLADPGGALGRAAARGGVRVEAGAVLGNGRVELLHYLSEQSCSEVTHRHGILR